MTRPKSTDRPDRAGAGRRPIRDAARPGAERLQRVLADAGVASRRACEALIEAGEVKVNGRVVRELPAFVIPSDRLEVSGRPVRAPSRGPAAPPKNASSGDRRPAPDDAPREATAGAASVRRLYVMLHKPRGVVSTTSDPAGRRTALDLVRHPSGARLFPVGRLDFDTQGLLLLTNDGDLANRLTHPRYGIHKTYRALVKGLLDEPALRELEAGIYLAERKEGRTVGAKRTARVAMAIVKRDRDRTVLDITLQEGRNRQVRRMLAKVGCPVKRLVRTRMGPLSLRALSVGQWRELERAELKALRQAAAGLVPEGEPPAGARRARPRAQPSSGPRRTRPKSESDRPVRQKKRRANPRASGGRAGR